jgi:acetylornithine deacetylase
MNDDALNTLAGRRDETVGLLHDLLRIPSVGGSAAESEIVQHVADLLESAGLEVDRWQLPLDKLQARDDFPGMEVERSEAWGVVARLPGTGDGPSLMFNGHLDVVPPGDPGTWTEDPFGGRVDGDLIYGRGACDMKGGVVSALAALLALHRSAHRPGSRPLGDVLFAGVIGEEDGGVGTFATLDRGWRPDACVITEPTELDIMAANGGALTFRIRVAGKASHACFRTSGVSAIERFQPVFSTLRRLEAERNAHVDPLMSRWDVAYPLEVGTVRAGDWSSTVPDLLVAEGRFGVALDEPVAEAKAAFERALAEHEVSVEWWGGQFASGRCPSGSDLVSRVRAAAGGEVSVFGAPYGSDLRLFTAAGVPTVQYGPGGGTLHAADECVSIDQVMRCAATLVRLVAVNG